MKNVEDMYVLSSMQQLMLWHALSGGEDVLFEQLRCTLRGPLDVGAFRQAWRTVVARHPALRTAFVWQKVKQPVQVVRQTIEAPWTDHDLSTLSADEQRAQFAAICDDVRRRGFELNRAPLLRCDLARLSDDVHRFAWSCHHLVLDGWCLGLVLGEVFAAYAALAASQQPSLPDARGFRDYIAWLTQQDEAQAETYWQAYLQGARPLVRLPVERDSLPAGETLNAEDRDSNDVDFLERNATCSAELSTRLAEQATSQRVTLGTLLNAAWALLLSRYTGRDDLLFGVAVAGRPAEIPGVESIVGPLMNNVPVRARVDPKQPVRQWLQELRGAQVEQAAFEHTPLERILSWTGLGAGRRLFDTLVVLENYPLDARREVAGIAIEDVQGTATANQALTLIAVPGPPLTLTLRYDRRRYDAPVVDTILAGLVQLLGELAVKPDVAPAELQIVGAEDLPALRAGGRAVLDSQGQPLPMGVSGQVFIGDESNTAPTGDWGRRLPDGGLEICGAVSDPAQVGAYRVDPQQIERALVGHRLVDAAFVNDYVDPDGETQLAAYFVPAKESKTVLDATEHAMLVDTLRSDLREQLPRQVVPAAFVVLETLPRTSSGEVDLAALPTPTRPRPASAGPPVVARDAMESAVVRIWEELLGVSPVGVTDSFVDLGGNSTLAVSLIGRIEEQFGRKLPLVSLYQEPTVENLARLLRREGGDDVSSLAPIQARGTKRPLFCIHPAGGTVFCYLELARHLDPDRPIYGLQALGVEGEAAPHTEVGEMAAHYRAAIREQQPEGPYLICGWSSGGILAFEVARQLEADGSEVALLALFDAGVQGDREFTNDDFLPMLLVMFPGESAAEIEALQDRGPEAQLAWFQERAELAQLVVAGAGATQAQYVFDVFQANINAIASYRPEVYGGRITLFRASEHTTPMHADPELGWGNWTTAGVDVYEVPGDHVTMFREPTIRVLAEKLQQCLKEL